MILTFTGKKAVLVNWNIQVRVLEKIIFIYLQKITRKGYSTPCSIVSRMQYLLIDDPVVIDVPVLIDVQRLSTHLTLEETLHIAVS